MAMIVLQDHHQIFSDDVMLRVAGAPPRRLLFLHLHTIAMPRRRLSTPARL